MKQYISLVITLIVFISVGCDKMEDNYAEYLEYNKVYSPKVQNLVDSTRLKEVTLYWDNPQGDIAKKILIDYLDDSILFDSMVDSALITGLEIKSYEISVYTIDAFGNYSVPESVAIFPNGENDINGN